MFLCFWRVYMIHKLYKSLYFQKVSWFSCLSLSVAVLDIDAYVCSVTMCTYYFCDIKCIFIYYEILIHITMNVKESPSVVCKLETHVTQCGSEYPRTSSYLPRAGESVCPRPRNTSQRKLPLVHGSAWRHLCWRFAFLFVWSKYVEHEHQVVKSDSTASRPTRHYQCVLRHVQTKVSLISKIGIIASVLEICCSNKAT